MQGWLNISFWIVWSERIEFLQGISKFLILFLEKYQLIQSHLPQRRLCGSVVQCGATLVLTKPNSMFVLLFHDSVCPQGSVWNSTTSACTQCPRGSYAPYYYYATSCDACPEGMTTNDAGSYYSRSCRPCKWYNFAFLSQACCVSDNFTTNLEVLIPSDFHCSGIWHGMLVCMA